MNLINHANDAKTNVEALTSRMDGEKLPLLTLTEFFENNPEEESIAPNQWGYGRPPLAEIWKRLQELEKRTDVAWVRVVLHPDTEARERDGEIVFDLAGDTIAICTTAKPKELEKTLDYESLASDGITRDFNPKLYTEIPDVPTGYKILTLWWD